MKADVSLSKVHKSLCIDLKNEKKGSSRKPFHELLPKEELLPANREMLVIPVEQLTEVQLRQVQELPGAYFLSTDRLLSNLPQQTPLQEENTAYNLKLVKHRFLVKHSTRLISVGAEQIAYFYAENRLNFIKTWNNKTYIVDKTIEEINSIINKDEFFRINRSYIISYKSIEEVHTHFNNRLKLKLSIAVPEELFVSKDRVANFKEWLGA